MALMIGMAARRESLGLQAQALNWQRELLSTVRPSQACWAPHRKTAIRAHNPSALHTPSTLGSSASWQRRAAVQRTALSTR